jgi:hypothetical protein
MKYFYLDEDFNVRGDIENPLLAEINPIIQTNENEESNFPINSINVLKKKTSKNKERFYYPVDSYKALVPKNLCFDSLLIHVPLRITKYYKEEYQLIDRIAGILDIILRRYLDSYKIKDLSEEVFISASKSFKPYYDGYANIIDYLISSNVIEIVTDYKKGANSRSYRLTEQYRNDGVRYYYIKDERVISKLSNKASHEPSVDTYPELYRYVQKVQIDKEKALELANEMFEGDENFTNKISQYGVTLDNVNSLTPFFKKDSSSGRLHTPISNLKKEFKQFLSIDGKPLVGLDIKSSQPFFLASLLNESTWKNYDVSGIIKKHSKHLSDEEITKASLVLRNNKLFSATNRLAYCGPTSIESPPLYPKSYLQYNPYSTGNLVKDIQVHRDLFTFNGTYSDLVLSGMLYEFISWNLGYKTRNEGKDEMWKILYNPPLFKCKGREVFKKFFPEVLLFADTINKGYVKTKKTGRKYGDQSSTLALLLQTLEAKFMLDELVPFIIKRFPKMPILTIHDSILVPEDYVQRVRGYMKRFAKRRLGLLPIIEVE